MELGKPSPWRKWIRYDLLSLEFFAYPHISIPIKKFSDRYIILSISDHSLRGAISPCPKLTVRLAGSPSCVSMLYPFVVVGLKSTFFEEDCHQQREPDVIRYLVRLYDISLEGNGSKSQQSIITTHLFHK